MEAVLGLGVLGLGAATLGALLGGATWPLSLLEHFRHVYLALAVAAALTALALAMWRWLDAAAVIGLLNAIVLAPTCGGAPLVAQGPATPVRLVALNVHTSSAAFDEVAALLAEARPDVLALVEVDQRWLDALAPALRAIGPCVRVPRDDNFGMALCARGELRAEVWTLSTGRPAIVGHAHIGEASLATVVAHPIPPIDPRLQAEQARELDELATLARAAQAALGPTVLVGDLNATPWSRPFVRLLAASGLRDSRAGQGVGATFPSALGWAGLPIDHALVSPGIGVAGRHVGRDVGSDHRPVVFDLRVPIAAR
jgi:endonuclease/exonuclease/phosphatase (EEP) superfamily protein YafD